MQLKMISPTDIALDQVDLNGSESLFNLKQIDESGVIFSFILSYFFYRFSKSLNKQLIITSDIKQISKGRHECCH